MQLVNPSLEQLIDDYIGHQPYCVWCMVNDGIRCSWGEKLHNQIGQLRYWEIGKNGMEKN